MFIIWGTRPYFHTKKVKQSGFCGNCDQFVKFSSYNAKSFFHLYYLPLVPTLVRSRYHKMCGRCATGTIYEFEPFQRIIETFKEQSADALVALLAGEKEFVSEPGQPPVDCIQFLWYTIDWLWAAGEAEFCQGLLTQLQTPHSRYSFSIVSALINTLRNQLDAAIENYQAAIVCESFDRFPRQQLAHLYGIKKRRDEAIASYQAALACSSDPAVQFPIYVQMVEHQLALKRYVDAAKSYDKIIEYQPQLATHPAIAKGMKKAKKYASKQQQSFT